MPARMSFSKTTRQFRDGSKIVTRRDKWLKAKPGDRITAIEKGMGLKKGEKQVVLGEIEVVSVRRERLGDITAEDCALEGFPGWSAADFVRMYGKPAETIVTRIEFKYVEASS